MQQVVSALLEGFNALQWSHCIMFAVGGILIFLAVRKNYEPMLLLPIGFGAILVNLPLKTILTFDGADGVLQILFNAGILTELFPVLIFIAVGAMIDFTPLFKMPIMIFFGAAAQFGIFATITGVVFLSRYVPQFSGMDPAELLKLAASVGIIGAADGPTSIFVASKFARDYLGPISVAAYSYMALVPIIQPPIMRLFTTHKERSIKMEQLRHVSKTEKIIFPLAVLGINILLLPSATPLIGALMFGNLIRESGVTERLSQAAQNELINLVTIMLGLSVGSKLSAHQFLRVETLGILALGLFAFSLGTAGGVWLGKLMNILSKKPINPLIGAAGVSAVPMAARVVNKVGQETNPNNYLLMHAMGPNVAGVIGSAVVAGVLLSLVPKLMGS